MQQPSRPQRTRRSALQLFGAGGAAALAAACAGPGSGGGKTSKGEALPTDGPVKGDISFAHWRGEDRKVLAELIKTFTGEHRGVTVGQDISPSESYLSSGLQRIRGGGTGDLFVAFRGAQFVDMVKAGLYADLSGTRLPDSYTPELIEAGVHEGTQYGLPYQLVFNQPVSNLDLMESVGVTEPPGDWDGWLAMCEDIRAAGKVPMAWPGATGDGAHLLNSMVMNNAPSDDMCTKIEAGEYKTTDDWFLKTLKQCAELRPYFQPNAAGTDVEPAEQLFAQGKAALLATGSFHMAAVRAQGAEFPMGMMAPITVSAGKRKYEGIHNATFILGVNAASDNKATALELLRFLSETEHASTYANGTAQHLTLKKVDYRNKDLAANSAWLEKKTLLCPRYQFMDLDVLNAFDRAGMDVIGGTSPEQAAERAQKIIDQRIDS